MKAQVAEKLAADLLHERLRKGRLVAAQCLVHVVQRSIQGFCKAREAAADAADRLDPGACRVTQQLGEHLHDAALHHVPRYHVPWPSCCTAV